MKVVVYTLGCKVNQYESDGLIYSLKQLGYEVSTEIEFADIYILNSCAVTNEAEKKSRQTIAKFKACNNNAKIIVCGCASQKNSNQFSNIANITLIKGTANKQAIVDKINSVGQEIDELSLEYEKDYIVSPSKTRAHIKIQDGCNNFCSYCIIPYLRGRSRSRNLDSILKEIEFLSKCVKEIVITGIDITDYKINGQKAITQLIEQLKQYNDVRFRLGSLEQGVIDEEFVKAVKNSNVCPHFHLSLQSGCDATLKRMNRKYTTKQFLDSVNYIKNNFENACITTDVIVGFPEESDEEFKQTCQFVQECGFYNMHIFPYSVRSGTVAEKMKQVDGGVKKERAKVLADINRKLNKNYIEKCLGKRFSVLIEEFDGEYHIGHTENYLKCYIKEECALNTFVSIKILKQYKDGVLAQKEN